MSSGLSQHRPFVECGSDNRTFKKFTDVAMEGSMKCIKYLLFGFNLLFAVRACRSMIK